MVSRRIDARGHANLNRQHYGLLTGLTLLAIILVLGVCNPLLALARRKNQVIHPLNLRTPTSWNNRKYARNAGSRW